MTTPSIFRRTLMGFALLAASGSALAFEPVTVNLSITEAEVQAAQAGWGKALLQISRDYVSGGHTKAKVSAQTALDAAYGYKLGAVLFKPTQATGEQTFRLDNEGALSYFVGGNPKYPGDMGFALKGWTTYEFRNAGVLINGNLALTMGHILLTDATGKITTIDKTWGFKKDDQGVMRIVLHHSSLPYSPQLGLPKPAAH